MLRSITGSKCSDYMKMVREKVLPTRIPICGSMCKSMRFQTSRLIINVKTLMPSQLSRKSRACNLRSGRAIGSRQSMKRLLWHISLGVGSMVWDPWWRSIFWCCEKLLRCSVRCQTWTPTVSVNFFPQCCYSLVAKIGRLRFETSFKKQQSVGEVRIFRSHESTQHLR
jgi:hypothetical protein